MGFPEPHEHVAVTSASITKTVEGARQMAERIAALEATLRAFMEAAPRAIYHLREEGYLRVCHELEAVEELAKASLQK